MIYRLKVPSLCLLAALIGYLCWNGDVTALLLLPVVIWVWSACPSRLSAFCALFSYYAAAGRGLLHGASMFFADVDHSPAWWIGIAIWLVPSALLSLTWAIGWGTRYKSLRLIFILVTLSFPPIGVIGWANPITAAGTYFPGLGWFGLAAMLFIFVLIVHAPRSVVLYPLALATSLSYAVTSGQLQTPSWIGVDTRLGGGQGISDEFNRLRKLQNLVERASRSAPQGAVLVLPELVGGDWTVNESWWELIEKTLREKEQSVFLGIHRPVAGGGYVNSLVGLGAASGTELVDRVPVPISMWKPWANDGAIASWWHKGVTEFHGKNVGHLICYEQLLIWPALTTFSGNPDVVVAVSNVWWAKDTSIPSIQHEAVAAWGRLFDVPVVFASNK